MLRILTTVDTEIEVDILLARLQEAGIPCMRSAGGVRSAPSSGRDVLVEEEDLERAREVLKAADGGFDEDELARLSEEAGREASKQRSSPRQVEPDVPDKPRALDGAAAPAKEHRLRRAFERLSNKREHGSAPPRDPFGR